MNIINKKYTGYYIVSAIIVILFFIAQNINNRFSLSDFYVYYGACNDLLKGTDIYANPYGVSSGFYKYSPFVALIFTPFSILPYYISSVVFYILISLCIIVGIPIVFNYITDYFKISNKHNRLLIIILFIILGDHFIRELNLGNINLFLTLSLVGLYSLIDNKKNTLAGISYGMIILFKPHFLILLPLFILRKKWKVIGFSLLSIALALLTPSFIYGFRGNLSLLTKWLNTMKSHNISEERFNHIPGFVSGKLDLIGQTEAYFITIFSFALLSLYIVLKHLNQEKKVKNKNNFFIEYFFLIGIVPNIVLTDTEHFMYSLPILIVVLTQLKSYPKYLKVIATVFLITYAFNWGFLWGKYTSVVTKSGILGISNLVLTFLFLFQNEKNKNSISTTQFFKTKLN